MDDTTIRRFVDIYDKSPDLFRGDQSYLYKILRNASNEFQFPAKAGKTIIAMLLLLYTTDGVIYMLPIYPDDKVKTVAAELQKFCGVPLWGYSIERVYAGRPTISMMDGPFTIC